VDNEQMAFIKPFNHYTTLCFFCGCHNGKTFSSLTSRTGKLPFVKNFLIVLCLVDFLKNFYVPFYSIKKHRFKTVPYNIKNKFKKSAEHSRERERERE
jgi:hypothetical protein